MLVAVIALAGTLLGAFATMLGTAINDHRQARSEEKRWHRDQLSNAYQQALRYLLRAADRRSQVDPALGAGVLKIEHHRDWFDDLAEARTWLMVLVSCCGCDQIDELRAIIQRLDLDVGSMAPDHGPLHHACDKTCCDMRTTARIIRDAAEAVAACARADLGREMAFLLHRQAQTALPPETIEVSVA